MTHATNGLTPRQKRWLLHYLNGDANGYGKYDATKAARAAGYGIAGARTAGWRNAHHPVIRQLVDAALEAQMARLRR
jgi:phage terminase small subunit